MYGRIVIVALVLLLLVSSIFSIWPVIADAPWEETITVPIVAPREPTWTERDRVNCEGALGYRNIVMEAIARPGSNRFSYIHMLLDAKAKIASFC